MTSAKLLPVTSLRDDLEALTALIQQTASALGIDQAFIEKDFWVTEVLRAVAPGATMRVGDTQEQVTVVFKGGTSLSRVFHTLLIGFLKM